jgi:hypothetical protein
MPRWLTNPHTHLHIMAAGCRIAASFLIRTSWTLHLPRSDPDTFSCTPQLPPGFMLCVVPSLGATLLRESPLPVQPRYLEEETFRFVNALRGGLACSTSLGQTWVSLPTSRLALEV